MCMVRSSLYRSPIHHCVIERGRRRRLRSRSPECSHPAHRRLHPCFLFAWVDMNVDCCRFVVRWVVVWHHAAVGAHDRCSAREPDTHNTGLRRHFHHAVRQIRKADPFLANGQRTNAYRGLQGVVVGRYIDPCVGNLVSGFADNGPRQAQNINRIGGIRFRLTRTFGTPPVAAASRLFDMPH